MSVTDQLRVVDAAFAVTSAAVNARIQQLQTAQTQASIRQGGNFSADAVIAPAGTSSGEGTALDATVRTESDIANALAAERENLTQAAIQTLIQTVQIGQAENARAAEKLNDLTGELVRWTRVIGCATIIAVAIAAIALVVTAKDILDKVGA